MPKTHTRISYTFDELNPDAQKRAVADVAEKLAGDWWDQDDNERTGEAILYTFAEKIGTPDFDVKIDGVTLAGWSCAYMQGDGVVFVGSLTRENAPNLPWVDGLVSVTLSESSTHNATRTWFVMADDAPESVDTVGMKEAIETAVGAAHQAGYTHIEYVGSDENAREWIDANEPDFNESGTLFA